MRLSALLLIIGILCAACSTSTPPKPAAEESAQNAATKQFEFVSDPAMKELMATKVEGLSEALWAGNVEETAPKTNADWKRFETAAVGLIDAGKAMMAPPLAKDEGKWKEEVSKFTSLAEAGLKGAQEKNLAALNDAANKMIEDSCTSCHKLYYTGQ
jgi:cytochrome c556